MVLEPVDPDRRRTEGLIGGAGAHLGVSFGSASISASIGGMRYFHLEVPAIVPTPSFGHSNLYLNYPGIIHVHSHTHVRIDKNELVNGPSIPSGIRPGFGFDFVELSGERPARADAVTLAFEMRFVRRWLVFGFMEVAGTGLYSGAFCIFAHAHGTHAHSQGYSNRSVLSP